MNTSTEYCHNCKVPVNPNDIPFVWNQQVTCRACHKSLYDARRRVSAIKLGLALDGKSASPLMPTMSQAASLGFGIAIGFFAFVIMMGLFVGVLMVIAGFWR
jgi:hypothetical protein